MTAKSILFLLFTLTVVTSANANSLSGLNKGMPFEEVKTWHQQFLAGNPTRVERLDALRSIVRASPYGERGLNRIFRNFDGVYTIDPRIPGVENSALKLVSASKSQRQGYVREILYAIEFYNDPRFQLVEMNRIVKRSWGNTDFDIIFRYGSRGLYGRLEVKNVSLNSQASDIKRIKGQIDKMAREYRRTGHLQLWVNRREVLTEIKQYAQSKGIPVFENVSTGRARLKDEMTSNEFKQEIARQAAEVQRLRAIQGGVQLAYGIWILKDSIPVMWDDAQTLWNANTRTHQAWRRLGEHSAFTVAGGAMTVSGGALLASQYAREGLQGKLWYSSRIGGVISLVALASGEAFMIWRYRAGDVSSKEFWTSQWMLGGSAAGGLAGSWIGGIVGGALTRHPVGATIGAAGGSYAGTWIGGKTALYFSDSYYDWRFAEIDQRYADFVYARYGVQ